MNIIGWLLTAVGVLLCIVGMSDRNDAISSYYGYGRYYNRGGIEDAELIMTIGTVVFVVGVLILLAYYLKYKGFNKGQRNINAKRQCLRCGNIVDVNTQFCDRCGNNMMNQYNVPPNIKQ